MRDRIVEGFAAGPRLLRDVGAGLDVLSGTGLRYARSRRRAQAELAGKDLGLELYRDIWAEAAGAAGARLDELGSGFFRFTRGDASTTAWFHEVQLDDAVSLRLALDKTLVHRLLTDEALPVPRHVEFHHRDLAPAREFLAQHGTCVVKPADDGSSGVGVTAGVTTATELRRAALRASRGHTRLLIEEQVRGEVYRLLYLDGDLIAVLRRLPPRLRGDGRSTLAQLIDAENRRRIGARGHAGVHLLTLDLDAVLTMERAGLTLGSVPGDGELVQVKAVTNQARPEDSETVNAGVADELVSQCRRAAQAIGVRLAGVDIITPGIGRPLGPDHGAIVEVNGTPGLHYHYQVADPERATRVAIPVLHHLFAQQPGGERRFTRRPEHARTRPPGRQPTRT
jgi:D-alanine-D-alanine ligase-like ATP-grasp enzyme